MHQKTLKCQQARLAAMKFMLVQEWYKKPTESGYKGGYEVAAKFCYFSRFFFGLAFSMMSYLISSLEIIWHIGISISFVVR